MSVRDQVVYRRPFGRWVLDPVVRRAYEAHLSDGTPAPGRAYSAFRKLYGNDDPSLFGAYVAAAEQEHPLLQLPAEPPGIAAGSIDRVVAELRTDGCAVLDRRLDEASCQALEDAARSATCTLVDADDGAPPRARYDEAAPQAVRYEIDEADLVELPAVQRLLADESLLAIAQQHLGAAPVQDLVTMWWTASRGRAASSTAAQQYHFDLDRVRFLKVFVYLTDVDDQHGPHVFVRGSHRSKPDALRRDGRHSDAEVERAFPGKATKIGGPRGTVFLADTLGMHKGTPVEVGHRLVFQLESCTSLFGAAYSRPEIRQPTPELAAAIERYPDAFARFCLASAPGAVNDAGAASERG
jgi:hypothetical protein